METSPASQVKVWAGEPSTGYKWVWTGGQDLAFELDRLYHPFPYQGVFWACFSYLVQGSGSCYNLAVWDSSLRKVDIVLFTHLSNNLPRKAPMWESSLTVV